MLELLPLRPLWKQKTRDLATIAKKAGVTVEEATAVPRGRRHDTCHHFEKPPAGSESAELLLFAAG